MIAVIILVLIVLERAGCNDILVNGELVNIRPSGISTILPLHFHYKSKFKVALNESCDYVLFDRCWKFIMDLWKLMPALWVLNKMEKRSRFHSI